MPTTTRRRKANMNRAAITEQQPLSCTDLQDSGAGDREIGAPAAAVRAVVFAAREDAEITRQERATFAR